MDDKTLEKYTTRAKIVKAMAHPSRLFIIDELAKGEKCVCELKDMIGADMSTVSKHLTLLKEAGIVRDEKRKNQVFYHLCCPCVLNVFTCIESVMRDNLNKRYSSI